MCDSVYNTVRIADVGGWVGGCFTSLCSQALRRRGEGLVHTVHACAGAPQKNVGFGYIYMNRRSSACMNSVYQALSSPS